jgi:cytoskeletal protein CcmA (bactofilin family)
MAAALIGHGLYLKGELRGEEDLIIEGTVEGTISIAKSLTIGEEGKVKANIETETVTIRGAMEGDLKARERIVIHSGARMIGDLSAPRVEIEDGAYFRGNVEMPIEGHRASSEGKKK